MKCGVPTELLASWVSGWALSRGVAPPTELFGGFRVEVGFSDQKARIVFPGLSGVREASRAIREPLVFLKACAPPDEVAGVLDHGWSLRPVSHFMILEELRPRPAPTPAGYRMQVRRLGAGGCAEISTGDGEPAARGSVFWVNDVAVFDRIGTEPAHRRRGLGRAVMAELNALSRSSGAGRGALVATADGRALYEPLGWRVASPYTTAVRG